MTRSGEGSYSSIVVGFFYGLDVVELVILTRDYSSRHGYAPHRISAGVVVVQHATFEHCEPWPTRRNCD